MLSEARYKDNSSEVYKWRKKAAKRLEPIYEPLNYTAKQT